MCQTLFLYFFKKLRLPPPPNERANQRHVPAPGHPAIRAKPIDIQPRGSSQTAILSRISARLRQHEADLKAGSGRGFNLHSAYFCIKLRAMQGVSSPFFDPASLTPRIARFSLSPFNMYGAPPDGFHGLVTAAIPAGFVPVSTNEAYPPFEKPVGRRLPIPEFAPPLRDKPLPPTRSHHHHGFSSEDYPCLNLANVLS